MSPFIQLWRNQLQLRWTDWKNNRTHGHKSSALERNPGSSNDKTYNVRRYCSSSSSTSSASSKQCKSANLSVVCKNTTVRSDSCNTIDTIIDDNSEHTGHNNRQTIRRPYEIEQLSDNCTSSLPKTTRQEQQQQQRPNLQLLQNLYNRIIITRVRLVHFIQTRTRQIRHRKRKRCKSSRTSSNNRPLQSNLNPNDNNSIEIIEEGHTNLPNTTSSQNSNSIQLPTLRESIQQRYLNIRTMSSQIYNTILQCFGRKDPNSISSIDLVDKISLPLPLIQKDTTTMGNSNALPAGIIVNGASSCSTTNNHLPVEMPDPNEINSKFSTIVDELDLTHENKLKMLELPIEKKYQIYCNIKLNEQDNVFNFTPEYYIDRLSTVLKSQQFGSTDKLYNSLKTSLRTQPNSFVQKFLQLNGLDLLLQNSPFSIPCLKSLLNNSIGRAFVLGHENALNVISESLVCDDYKVKIDVLEILGAVCLIPGGHKKVLDAVGWFKEWYGERVRFQSLVTELNHLLIKPTAKMQNQQSEEYHQQLTKQSLNIKTAIISFLNAILSYGPGQTSLEYRLHLRYELLMLGIIPITDKLRTAYSDSIILIKHLDFFNEMRLDDEREFSNRFNESVHINLNDLNGVFGLICEKLVHSVEYSHFSSLLVHLLKLCGVGGNNSINGSENCGGSDANVVGALGAGINNDEKRRWLIIDKLVQQIVLDFYNVQDEIVVEDLVERLSTTTILNLEQTSNNLSQENKELQNKLTTKNSELEQLLTELMLSRNKYQDICEQFEYFKAAAASAAAEVSQHQKQEPHSSTSSAFSIKLNALKNSTSSSITSPSSMLNGNLTSTSTGNGLNNPSTPTPPPPPPPPPPSMILQKPKKHPPPKPSTVLKSFNWSKLPECKIQPGTIWWNLQEEYNELDLLEIDRLFGATGKASSGSTGTSSNGGTIPTNQESTNTLPRTRILTTIIDSRRAQNCTILLSKLKMSDNELCQVILNMDKLDILSIDMIEQLLKFIPSQEEKLLLEEHAAAADTLTEDEICFSRADMFLLNVSRIPNYEQRLLHLQFRKKFPSLYKDLHNKMNSVIKGCEELQNSQQLQKILQLVLSIGNYMNKGTRGNASGFKLSSLIRLTDTKSNSTCKSTLVNYLVKLIDEKNSNLLSLLENNELKHVKDAAKVSLPELEKDMNYLRSSINLQEIDQQESTNNGLNTFEIKYKIESLEKLFIEMRKRFQQTIAYFSEDYTQIDEFFQIFEQFLNQLNDSKIENQKRLKKKKDEEFQQLQQNTLRRQSASKKGSIAAAASAAGGVGAGGQTTGNSNNDFDDLISALRTGDVFSDLDNNKKKRCRKLRERIH